MELKLVNGDYVPDMEMGTGFETVTGIDEIFQRVLFKLKVQRGSFPLIPDLGSDLWKIHKEKKSNRESAAFKYIAEALQNESMINIKNVTVSDTHDGIKVDVKLQYNDETASLSIEI